MNLTVTGHHIDVTPAIRDYLTSKLARVTRHFDHVIDVSVILSVEKARHKAEASVRVRGKDLFAEADDTDMYAAIDSLVDKLDRTVLRHKEKQVDRRNGASLKQIPGE